MGHKKRLRRFAHRALFADVFKTVADNGAPNHAGHDQTFEFSMGEVQKARHLPGFASLQLHTVILTAG